MTGRGLPRPAARPVQDSWRIRFFGCFNRLVMVFYVRLCSKIVKIFLPLHSEIINCVI